MKFAGASLKVHAFIVRQVDGDGLTVGVAVAGVIHGVVSGEIDIRAWDFFLVLFGHGKLFLEFRHEGGVAGQLLGPFLVLDQDEGLVGSLDAIAGVRVVLDGSDDHVDIVVADIHPAHVAFKVVIGTEGFGAESQVVGKLFVASEF